MDGEQSGAGTPAGSPQSNMGSVIGIIVIILIVIAVVWWAVSTTSNENTNTTTNRTTNSVVNTNATAGSTATATFAEQSDSGLSGTASIRDVSGKAQVTLSLSGGTATDVHPAHIHKGTCAELGAILYTLDSVEGNASTTTLDDSATTVLGQKPVAIEVHKSTSELGVYYACADVVTSSATTNTNTTTTANTNTTNTSGY